MKVERMVIGGGKVLACLFVFVFVSVFVLFQLAGLGGVWVVQSFDILL